MFSIEVKNLFKIYNKFGKIKEALSDININIKEGCFYGLLGPNGAGKSSLINIISGCTNKTSGEIKLCGYDIDKDNIRARYTLGVVPQELILDPFFTVRETIENYCNYYAISNVKQRTSNIIDALGLSDKADIHPRKLSGGMQRRLLVAKALVHDPKILILDEPTAGVDIILRKQLWEYVRELNKQGTTIILTTHYLEEAQELCDHITILDQGKVVASSKKSELVDIIDYKDINISFFDDIISIPDNLKDFDCKVNIDKSITIRYKKFKDQTNDIVRSLTQTDLRIKDISTRAPDLQDIFSHLIEKNNKI